MDALSYKKKKVRYLFYFIALWVLQMTAAFWFCTQKQGFHEDEYYTYYSTARTNGFYVEDGRWMDRDTYRDEFVVLSGQRFQYGLVRQVQSWDVHPPMYYWVFHTAASLVPGVFSKWIGLSVNLLFHGINLILLTYLSYLAAGEDGKLALLVTFVYGFCPAAMSGVVFIRMYEMLTTFVLLCAVWHVRAIKRMELSVMQDLLPMAITTYIGFLTQYYYFIFLFFLSCFFCVWLLYRDRKLDNCLRYGFFQAAAFGFAYVTYPVFPAQMFRGQRGAQATESFFDLSNTFERLCFFSDLMNRYVFGGLLSAILLVLVAAGAAYLWVIGKKRGESRCKTEFLAGNVRHDAGAVYGALLFVVVGYFVTVSKTALLLGDTSVRYQLPIYGIVVLLVFLAGRALWRKGAVQAHSGQDGKHSFATYTKGAEWFAVIFCVVMTVWGYQKNEVEFLYREDAAQTAFAREQAEGGALAVYMYNPGEEWCIWDVTNELLAYPEVYFVRADGTEEIRDKRIEKAKALVVYLAKGADVRGQLDRLYQKDDMPVQNSLQLMFEEKYCDVYSAGELIE